MDNSAKLDLNQNFMEVNRIEPALYRKYDVKRGLRNADGTGVIAGMTNVSNVHGYVISDGEKLPDEGHLSLRGYDLYDLLGDLSPEHRFNFEEVAYLLIMGELPTQEQLDMFVAAIDEARELPDGFFASQIVSDTPPDIMNMLSRSVLSLYLHDPKAEERSVEHEIRTAISLISRLPRISVLGYHCMRARYFRESWIMHRFIPGQSTAETILSALRPDRQFTPEEARMLDVLLCLHCEHGGGNNSTFTMRVMSSADTDPYSAFAGAIGSLKGHRHGGANFKVRELQDELKVQVANWEDEDQVAAYLEKVVRKEASDHSGLIYGMGHAVYTLSDPRAVICKRFAEKLAAGTEYEAEYNLLQTVERLAPQVIANVKGTHKDICANIDMYTGFVYRMMGVPENLFTPLFACARMAGWTAHRFEEIGSSRIIRPAYKNASREHKVYLPIDQR